MWVGKQFGKCCGTKTVGEEEKWVEEKAYTPKQDEEMVALQKVQEQVYPDLGKKKKCKPFSCH